MTKSGVLVDPDKNSGMVSIHVLLCQFVLVYGTINLNDGYIALGCYQDQGDQRILPVNEDDHLLTTLRCITFCSNKNFSYAGTEWGRQCWCGDGSTIHSAKKLPDSSCAMACFGNKHEICGGSYTINIYELKVNGNWGTWSEWNLCSLTCGNGTKSRNRTCTDPTPLYGGRYCDGSNVSTEVCLVSECPVNGNWGTWSEWSVCSLTCGNGTKSRNRTCTDPTPFYGGRYCDGSNVSTEVCLVSECPVNGNWGTWSNWSVCSLTCGNGTKSRNRTCTDPTPLYGGRYCNGSNISTEVCLVSECPVNGNWGTWSKWSVCSLTCGNGTKSRNRTCTDPTPLYGGRYCDGSNISTEVCLVSECPDNGNWSTWSEWSICSLTCGNGTKSRKRTCTNPTPLGKRRYCDGIAILTEVCSVSECPGYCPAEFYANVAWRKTAVGERDINGCPNGYSGNSSRLCSWEVKWEDPVYINCTDKALQELSDKLENLEEETNHTAVSAVIAGVLNQILNKTAAEGDHDKTSLKSGDLKKTTDILATVIRIGNSTNVSINSTELFSVIDNVLNSKNTRSWNEFSKEETTGEGSARIMRIVEDLGSLIQKGINRNETMTFKKNNIEIEISTMLEKTISFPAESKSQLSLLNQPSLKDKFYTAALYKTLSSVLPTTNNSTVGSEVLSLSFSEKIDLSSNITIAFERNKQINITNPEVTCGFWNFISGSWSYEGCYLQKSDPTLATCTCNHLTNFAIIMSPGYINLPNKHVTALEIITFVGCSLSILGCLLTLFIYSCFWRYVKNEWAVILINLCIALIIGYSIFLGAVRKMNNDVACNIITAILHYVFLVVFLVMLVEGISVVTSVTVVFKKKSKLKIYLAFAWIVPLFIVGATMGITQLKGYHSDKYCWLNVNNYVILAFVGPAMVIILINIIAIVFVLRAVYSTTERNNEQIREKAMAGIKCMGTLLPVLGLSWLFGVLAFNQDTIIFQYLFGVTTSCQGLFIFIFHTVLNKKVHEGFHQTLYRHRSRAMSNPSSKLKSFGTYEQQELRGSNTDTAKHRETNINVTKITDLGTATNSSKLKQLLTDSPRLREVRNYFKMNRSKKYIVTET